MATDTEKRRALINMDLVGTTGPLPEPNGDINTARLRHFLGLFPFEEQPIPGPEVPYNFQNDYFKAPSDETMSSSISSELPDGEAWEAKFLVTKYMYALVFAAAGCLNVIMKKIQSFASELNINTAVELLPEHEASVSLPDSRIEDSNPTIESRRANVKDRLSRNPIVIIQEMQQLIDNTLPNSGIWLSTGQDLEALRYTLRYTLGGRGYKKRFKIVVNMPEFSLDQISWENLLSWLEDFSQSGVYWIQNIIPEDQSYVVVTYPTDYQTIYAQQDFEGDWTEIIVKWMAIDKLNTVVHEADEEIILPSTTEIKRLFTDSDLNIIEGETNPPVIEI